MSKHTIRHHRHRPSSLPGIACALLCTFVAIGCGDSKATQNTGGKTPAPAENNSANNTTNNTANNGGDPGDNNAPATGDVALRIELDPLRMVYAPEVAITARAVVTDTSGAPVTNLPVSWEVTPATHALISTSGRLDLLAEGEVELRGCVSPAGGSAVCAMRTIVIDAGPPSLTVHEPEPGAELSLEDGDAIVVRGHAEDAWPGLYVHVNGVPVEVGEGGAFEARVAPRYGINSIEVVASDGLHAEPTRTRFDVLWAASYLPTESAGGSVAMTLEDAVVLSIGQRFLDDGAAPVAADEQNVVAGSLASLMHLVLEHLDLMAYVPDPIVDSSALTLRVVDVTFEDPRVSIDVVDGGLDLFVRVPALVAHTRGNLEFGSQRLDLDGSIVAQLSLGAHIAMDKPGPGEPFAIEIDWLELALENAEGRFASPEANAVFALAESALRDTLEAVVLEAVDASFVDALPGMLADVFGSLESALASNQVDVDPGTGVPLILDLSGQFGHFAPRHRTGPEAVVRMTTGVDANAGLATRGVALSAPYTPVDPAAGVWPFTSSGHVQLGIRTALVNGILHTLWSAGMFELDVRSYLPPGLSNIVSEGDVSAGLPPYLTLASADEAFDLHLTLGQLEFDFEIRGQQDRFGANIVVGASFVLSGEVLELVISERPRVEVWLTDTTGRAPRIEPATLEDVILTQLWPRIRRNLGDSLAIALPLPGAAELESIAPALSRLELGLEMTRPLTVRDDFIVIEAAIEARLPLGP